MNFLSFKPVLRPEWPITWPNSSLHVSLQFFEQPLALDPFGPSLLTPFGAQLIQPTSVQKLSKMVGNLTASYLYSGCSGRYGIGVKLI